MWGGRRFTRLQASLPIFSHMARPIHMSDPVFPYNITPALCVDSTCGSVGWLRSASWTPTRLGDATLAVGSVSVALCLRPPKDQTARTHTKRARDSDPAFCHECSRAHRPLSLMSAFSHHRLSSAPLISASHMMFHHLCSTDWMKMVSYQLSPHLPLILSLIPHTHTRRRALAPALARPL